MKGVEIRSVGSRLSIGGVELPGRCVDYTVDDDTLNPFLRVGINLLVPRAAEPPAPAFRDDGRDHYMDVSTAGATTPSGKRACSTCGEAWMCSTALRRWEVTGSTQRRIVSDSEADALRRIDATRRRVHELQAANRISPTTAEILLQILNWPAPAVDKSSDAPLD